MGVLIMYKNMRKENKLLWLSIAIIIIVDVTSYFTAGTTERNLLMNIPLFVILVLGISLLLFSLKNYINENKKWAIIGFLIGSIIGILSLGSGVYILIFLLPIFSLIQNLSGCAGEDCWSLLIILSSLLLGLIGMFIGIFLQNKKLKKK